MRIPVAAEATPGEMTTVLDMLGVKAALTGLLVSASARLGLMFDI